MSFINKKEREKMTEEKAKHIECMVVLALLDALKDTDKNHVFL